MIIYLFRHGKTSANEKRLYCGSTNLSLSQAGIKELKMQPALPKAAIYAHSGMKRAVESLNILCNAPTATSVPDLAEINFGDFEMLSYEQLKENPLYIQWIEDKLDAPPKGESKSNFRLRILNGFDQLKKLCGENEAILALTHGGVIATLMEELMPGTKNFYQWQPACGHGIKIEIINNSVVKTEDI